MKENKFNFNQNQLQDFHLKLESNKIEVAK
nr:MAG TPA: hypothetical protein [Caudoviricetes sp.]